MSQAKKFYKRKNLGSKSQELRTLKFFGRRFVSESIFHENQQPTNADNLKVPARFTLRGSLTML